MVVILESVQDETNAMLTTTSNTIIVSIYKQFAAMIGSSQTFLWGLLDNYQ